MVIEGALATLFFGTWRPFERLSRTLALFWFAVTTYAVVDTLGDSSM